MVQSTSFFRKPPSPVDPNQFERGETEGNMRNDRMPSTNTEQYEVMSGSGNRGQYRNVPAPHPARGPSAKNGRKSSSSSSRGHKAA